MKDFTRKDYMEGRITFDQYYSAIAQEAGISYVNSTELPRIMEALNTDAHLNNIPLSYWDERAESIRSRLSAVFKKHGDFYSLGGGVCAHKAAAKKAVQS